jgi:hypothetical protein
METYMKTIIKITKQEAIEAWKKQNKSIKADVVEIESDSITAKNGTTIQSIPNWTGGGITLC